MKKLITICAVAGVMAFATSVAYALPSDNFDDGTMDTALWTLYEDNHSEAWLHEHETNLRLEFRSTASAADVDALYIANNWGLLTTNDFSLKIDFHHDPSVNTSESSVLLGLAKDVNNYLTLEAGDDGDPYFWYEIESDGLSDAEEGEEARAATGGTLYISYDESEDELYLSATGYWIGAALFTIDGLLQGEWSGEAVGPFLGGWSEFMTLDSGNAHLDNFVVDSGVPEPATIALLGLGSLALLRRKRKA